MEGAVDGAALPRVPTPWQVVGQSTEGVLELSWAPASADLSAIEGPLVIAGFALDAHSSVDLLVERMDLFTADARIVLGTAAGDQPLPPPPVTLLSGRVLGETASRVYLSLSDDGQYGYVIRDGRTFVLSTGPAGAGLPPVLFDPRALPDGLIEYAPFDCLTDTSKWLEGRDTGGGDAELAYGARCRVALVAVETDWEYTGQIFGGDTTRSAAYAVTLWGAVSEIYTRDVNTRIRLSFLRVWDADVDPYAGGGLGEFQNYWNANMGDVERHAAHILSSMYGGGVAYLPGLCNWGYEYGLSGALSGYFPYPLRDHHYQNWDPFVVSHELGHNFGAPHTHDHSPPIDGCGLGDCTLRWEGTIMSYCHGCRGGMSNINLRFHERTLTEAMLPYLDRGVRCDLLSDPECDVQCSDIRRARARCRASGNLTVKFILSSDAHHGQTLTVSFNGQPFDFVIDNDRVVQKICCFGDHVTVTLDNPPGCLAPLEAPCQ